MQSFTNMAEVFNGVMKGARFLPVAADVELTIYRVNKWFVKKREIARQRLASNHMYTSYIERKIEANRLKARYHSVEPFDTTNGKYEVKTGKGERIECKGRKRYIVNFSNHTCTCKKVRVFHYPCSHVLAVCSAYSLSEEPFVDRYFRTISYMRTYEPQFEPVLDTTQWREYNGLRLISYASRVRTKVRLRLKRTQMWLMQRNRT